MTCIGRQGAEPAARTGLSRAARVFKPGDYNLAALNTLPDQVVASSAALAPSRQPTASPAA